jgi:membrane-bound lytic murein transglycosylase D
MHYAPQHKLCKAIVDIPVVSDTIMINQRIHLEQVATILNIPIEQIRLLNPQYRKDIIPGNIKPYSLVLPIHYAGTFIDKLDEVVSYKADSLINNRRSEIEIAQNVTPATPGGSGKVIYHTVKKGQTLGGIAAKYGVSLTKLKNWNNIKGSNIRIGQKLKIIK